MSNHSRWDLGGCAWPTPRRKLYQWWRTNFMVVLLFVCRYCGHSNSAVESNVITRMGTVPCTSCKYPNPKPYSTPFVWFIFPRQLLSLNDCSLIIIARPRFELGSKAPKASMLGHYIRQNFHSSTGLPGVFSVHIAIFRMLRTRIQIWKHLVHGIFHFLEYAFRQSSLFCLIILIREHLVGQSY